MRRNRAQKSHLLFDDADQAHVRPMRLSRVGLNCVVQKAGHLHEKVSPPDVSHVIVFMDQDDISRVFRP